MSRCSLLAACLLLGCPGGLPEPSTPDRAPVTPDSALSFPDAPLTDAPLTDADARSDIGAIEGGLSADQQAPDAAQSCANWTCTPFGQTGCTATCKTTSGFLQIMCFNTSCTCYGASGAKQCTITAALGCTPCDQALQLCCGP